MNPSDKSVQADENVLSLSALNQRISKSIKNDFPDEYWITAEISEMSVNTSGHCYLEIIEKEHGADNIIARSKAIIWAYTFRMIKPFFETTAGISLSPGIKVMTRIEVTFHEVYGLSLVIKDINPGFTVGEMALRKQEIIRQLKEEGIFDMNRRLSLPLVPQRIAIVSSEHAAGFQDFITHIEHNDHRFSFEWTLFPVMMQGKETEPTVIQALEKINEQPERFDLVVIIRGGGAQADLGAFNQYRIAAHIAQFPLPVITGIGHEKDESVSDLVARISLKTPTAVAQFLIDRMLDFEQTMYLTIEHIKASALKEINHHQRVLKEQAYTFQSSLLQIVHHTMTTLKHYPYRFRNAIQISTNKREREINTIYSSIERKSTHQLDKCSAKLRKIYTSITYWIPFHLEKQIHTLALSQKTLLALDPSNTLKRGYSITLKGKQIIRDASKLSTGDMITTHFDRGKKKSKII